MSCVCPHVRYRDDDPHYEGCPEYVERPFVDCDCWLFLRFGRHYTDCPNYSESDSR